PRFAPPKELIALQQVIQSRARPESVVGAPPLQTKAGGSPEAVTSTPAIGGAPMPADVQSKMESAFGADFSQVRLHEGPFAPSVSALAATQGTDIHFAPGLYAPH